MSTSPFRRNNLARPLLPSCLPDSHLLRYLPYVLDTPCIRSYLRISITPSLSRSLSIATLFSASNRPHLSQLTKQSQAESASQRESGSALHQLIRSVLAANPPPRRLNLGHGVAPPLVPEPLRMIRVRSSRPLLRPRNRLIHPRSVPPHAPLPLRRCPIPAIRISVRTRRMRVVRPPTRLALGPFGRDVGHPSVLRRLVLDTHLALSFLDLFNSSPSRAVPLIPTPEVEKEAEEDESDDAADDTADDGGDRGA